jgi:hypothetical protein
VRPQGQQPYPWVVPDLFRWFGLLCVAAVTLVVAWWGVSGTSRVAGLITWVNVGVGAVVVSGLANMTWLLQGRRAVAARRRALFADLGAGPPAADVMAVPDVGELRLAVPGATRHHRAGCVALAGKPVERATVAEHERRGRRPCGLCDPKLDAAPAAAGGTPVAATVGTSVGASAGRR